MFHSELQIRVRHEELRREADHQRLVRQAAEGARAEERAVARSGADESGGRVSGRRGRRVRVRRAAA
ncbi:hypothetical protein ACWIG3_20805 [Streptomyces celluloflavus]|uniref:hypothetical protein n=1 Tax=Streptomyces TaxID=1883 RepID=UPI00069BA74B|nr:MULTISPECIES: hypothetical protein [Streptomyces]MYU53881.1 hypothetical protein [Streptomyces sp. SID7805]